MNKIGRNQVAVVLAVLAAFVLVALAVEGRCSIGNYDEAGELSITCKTGPNEYKKHYLGRSDNVTYFAEQLKDIDVNEYRYRVIFKPESILPDVDTRTS